MPHDVYYAQVSKTRDAQQLPGGDGTHVVRHMVTHHHLARLVDNDTV